MKRFLLLCDLPGGLAMSAVTVIVMALSWALAAAGEPPAEETSHNSGPQPNADGTTKPRREPDPGRTGPLLEDDGREFFFVPTARGLVQKKYTGRKLSGDELRSDPRWKFQNKEQHKGLVFILCMIGGAGFASLCLYARFRYDRERIARDIQSRRGHVESFRMRIRPIRSEYDVIYRDQDGKRRRGTCIVRGFPTFGSTVYWKDDHSLEEN